MNALSDVGAAVAAIEAQQAVAARVLRDAAGMQVVGTFFLSGQEFALPADHVREVVGMPERITPIPLSPGCLEGIFTLRGAAIPLLNLGRIFDPAAPAASAEQRVAIVDVDDIQVGLVFDATGEVLRVRPEQRAGLRWRDGEEPGVVLGAITLDDGARIVQMLDAARLVRIDNVPQVRAHASVAREAWRMRFLRQAQGRKCISFTVGGLRFALAMEAIQEIMRVPELQPSVMLGRLCQGWLNLRGAPVGVVDFGALLQCAPGMGDPDDRRVLVVRVGAEHLGLLVDAVDDIRPYFDSDILPIPMLGTARGAMYRGCLPNAEQGDSLFLAHEALFSDAEVSEICAGHRRLYADQANAARAAGKKAGARRVYLAFSLGEGGWAADIGQVREIVGFDGPITRPPGMPACVRGMMQVRQQMVCVVDLRTLYGMAPLEDRSGCRVLVLEHEGERFGLVVDRVDTILSLPDSQRRPSPQLLRVNGPDDMRRDAVEVLEVPGEDGREDVLTLLDKERFLATLRQQLSLR
ncbi:chemotaxis protein CheW [Telluria beijingensis]|uniref:chemotaxis protein CheW n=1 Tax=Telluria beijingensis TaxID=3068633 RepID=UPI00279579EF|nr:chemotaxis protein CheW [Massilia sp. REN29]